jgi:hypothetical protein
MLQKIKNFIMYPYTQYKLRKAETIRKQRLAKKLKKLQEQDPFIYD